MYATVIETLRICGILLQPFMPTKAAALLDALKVEENERTLAHAELGKVEARKVKAHVRLFDPIEPTKASHTKRTKS